MKEVEFRIGSRAMRAAPIGPPGSIDRFLLQVWEEEVPGSRRGAKKCLAVRLEGPQEEGAPDNGVQWKSGRHSAFGSAVAEDGVGRNPAKLLLIRLGVELSFDQGGVGGDGDGRKGVPANRLRT